MLDQTKEPSFSGKITGSKLLRNLESKSLSFGSATLVKIAHKFKATGTVSRRKKLKIEDPVNRPSCSMKLKEKYP